MRALLLAVVVLTVLGCAPASMADASNAYCPPPRFEEQPLEFVHLAQGMLPASSPLSEAALYVAQTPKEADAFTTLLPEDIAGFVKNVDFENQTVVAAFTGPVRGAAGALKVRTAQTSGPRYSPPVAAMEGWVEMRADLTVVPAPEAQSASANMTSPYDIIVVPKDQVPAGSWLTGWSLVIEDRYMGTRRTNYANALHIFTGPPVDAALPVEVALDTPGQMERGQPATFRLGFENHSDEPAGVPLGTAPAYMVIVVNAAGETVWRSSVERGALGVEGGDSLVLGGHEERWADLAWDQSDSKGRPLPDGLYRACALVTYSPFAGEKPRLTPAGVGVLPFIIGQRPVLSDMLEVTLDAPSKAKAGSKVDIALKVKNISGHRLALFIHGDSDGALTRMNARNSEGEVAWSPVFAITDIEGSVLFEAGEVKTLTSVWDLGPTADACMPRQLASLLHPEYCIPPAGTYALEGWAIASLTSSRGQDRLPHVRETVKAKPRTIVIEP